MVDWTYIPDESARWKGMTKKQAFKPLRSRLKHKLEYHKRDDRWKCAVTGCDFVLGVHGHVALYGKCPFKPAKKTLGEKHQRFPRRPKSFLQGELLPPLEDEPKAATNKRKTNKHVGNRTKRR